MTLTTNKNFLSPVGFQFSIDATKFPNVEYFCTAVTLPDISVAEVPTPYKTLNMAVAGDRIAFSSLALRFNITENMENYIEMFNWMNRIVKNDKQEVADATLSILSSHNNVTKQIIFKDCFPTNLSSVEFSTQQTDIEYLQADVTLKFTEFEVK